MTPTEEAGLRTALAEREKRLAQALMNTNPAISHDMRALREGIERLRRELQKAGHP